jgi:hypothetical protein
MRTKTFLITAALSVVAATSWSQVYSVNAVGYVNLTLPTTAVFPPTKGSIIANPLNGTNNSLNTILPLPDAYVDSIIYRFDVGAATYSDAISYYGTAAGWLDPLGNTPSIDPGEAVWAFPVGPNPLNVTFVGEVPQGNLSNPLPAGGKFSMRSSIVPQAAPIGDDQVLNNGDLDFAAEADDIIYVYDNVAGAFKEAYTYYSGFGWNSANADDPGPVGPTIPVATGFFLQKGLTATKTAWVRSFSVN